MIALKQIKDTKIFAFKTVLIFKLLCRKVLLIIKKTIETAKRRLFFKKKQISRLNYCNNINNWDF